MNAYEVGLEHLEDGHVHVVELEARNVEELIRIIRRNEVFDSFQILDARLITHICPECDEKDHEIKMANAD